MMKSLTYHIKNVIQIPIRYFLVGIYLLTICSYELAQDSHFSQADQLNLYFNPASTGFYNTFYRASTLYRQQWTNIGKGFTTIYASFDAPIYDKRKQRNKAGLGGYFYSDVAGDSKFKTTQISLSSSGIVPLSKHHFLAGGIQISYIQKSYDLSSIQWVNQYNGKKYDASINPMETITNPFTSFLDVGIGGKYEYHSTELTFSTKSFQLFAFDAALFHVTQPLLQYTPLTEEIQKNRFVLQSQYLHDFENNKLGVHFYALYMQQAKFQEWMAMALLRIRMKQESQITGLLDYSILSTGIIFRNTGFIIPNIRLQLSDFEIGLCYDVFFSIYQALPKGMNAFEIQLTYSKQRNSLRNLK